MKSFDCATYADATQVSHSDDDTGLPVPLTYFSARYIVGDVHQMGTIRDIERQTEGKGIRNTLPVHTFEILCMPFIPSSATEEYVIIIHQISFTASFDSFP